LKYLGFISYLLCIQLSIAGGLSAKKADSHLKEVKTMATDIGVIWNSKFDAEIMVYQPGKRKIVTTVNTVDEKLKPKHGWFVGKLPKTETNPETHFSWGGRQWFVITWPVSENYRPQLIVDLYNYFSYSWRQPGELESCDYLKEAKAKELLDLEFRALKIAAQTSRNLQIAHVRSAFFFRALRYQMYPQAKRLETRLETTKGLLAYTMMCLDYPEREGQLNFLAEKFQDPNSQALDQFYQFTAPMYAVMLDRKGKGVIWKNDIGPETNIGLKWANYNFMKIKDNLEQKVNDLRDVYLNETYLKE